MWPDMREERFLSGRRFWCADGKTSPAAAEPWHLSKQAMNDAHAPVRVMDLPLWFQGDQQAIRELLIEECHDPIGVVKEIPKSLGIEGIEIDRDIYQPGECSIRWRTSPDRERLRGQVLLARLEPECLGSVGFQSYLLRLNWSIRFAGLWCCDEGIAVRVVLPTTDERWRALATSALTAVVRHLQPQIAWWSAPAELLADLFEGSQVGVVT